MIFFRVTFLELIAPFLLTLGVTSFVLMMGKIYNVINLMVERHVVLGEGVLMFAFLLPQSLTLMLPIGVLGAAMITVIRQSIDSEVIALRASGKSLWGFTAPIAAFGLLTVALTSVMTIWVQPAANRNFLDLQVRIIREHAEDSIVPGDLNFDFGDKVIRIGERLPDKEVRSVFLADRVLRPGSPMVVADRGRIIVDQERRQVVFRLEDGWMYTEDADPAILSGSSFRTLDYVLELGGRGRIDTREVEARWGYSTSEVIRRIEEATTPVDRRRLTMELYTRFVTPWACLGFAVAAVPLALLNPRSGRTGGILRGLSLVLAYYILWIAFRDLVMSGDAHSAVLILPALLIGLFGAVRIWRLNARGG
jgi:lipopolysaccharide export system permease protein